MFMKHCACEYAGPGMLEKMCPMHEAAPKLLEALEALAAAYIRDVSIDRYQETLLERVPEMKQARAAIAKAKR